MNLKKGDRVAIVCCSNGQDIRSKEKIDELGQVLLDIGLVPIFSEYIYDKGFGFSGTGLERANTLMEFYRDDSIKAIFDISGGDIGNEVLPYLDFDIIKKSDKLFWGYSDLTTIINAIYTKTGKASVLYQVRNLVNDDGEMQTSRFIESVIENGSFEGGRGAIGKEADFVDIKCENADNSHNLDANNEKTGLFDVKYEFIQGESMNGVVVGGNIRCLLKLAGTPYWPEMRDKILLLESRSGRIAQMTTYLNQLKQMGVFEQVKGVILGTFTELERNPKMPHVKDVIGEYVDSDMPVVYTREIGHGVDSKAIVIGMEIEWKVR